MKRLFLKYKADNTGVMTMEFMVLVPILLMWFAGMFVFFDAFHKWMKSLKATYTVTDMLTRQTNVDDNYITALDKVFDRISHTKASQNSWLRISQVRFDDGQNDLVWTVDTKSGAAQTSDATMGDLDKHVPLLTENEYVLIVQSYRPFNPVFSWVGLDSSTFGNALAAPLRFTSKLTHLDRLTVTVDSDEGVDDDNPDADSGSGSAQ